MNASNLVRRVVNVASLIGLAAITVLSGLSGATASAATTYTIKSNVNYSTDTNDKLDEYLPTVKAPSPTPAVIFVHGGGWYSGNKSNWATYAEDFVTKTGWPAFAINYDMTTSTPYVNEPQDVTTAINWIKTYAKYANIDPHRIGLVGESAGGHLSMLAATTGSGPSSDMGRVKAVVSWSGPTDLPLLTQDAGCYDKPCVFNDPNQWIGSVAQWFEGNTLASDAPDQWAATSPVNQVDPTDPPTLLFNSTDELVHLDQMQEMQSKLQTNGVPVKTVTYSGTQHAMAYASKAWPTTLSWLKTNL